MPDDSERLQRLALGIAHDLNGAITVLQGNAEIALMRVPEGTGVHRQLTRIHTAAHRLTELATMLADYAHPSGGATPALDLPPLVDSIIPAVHDEPALIVHAEPDALRCILQRLLENAREAGETVRVRTCRRSGRGALEVRDDGDGMTETVRRLMFDPYFTTRTGRKGLGLAQVAGLARAQGATIDVETAPGGGTRIWVLFRLWEG